MPKNRKLQNIIGTEHIKDSAEAAIAAQASGGATVAFKNVAVSGQDNIVADAATDTFNVAAGNGITLTTTAGTDTLTVAAAGYTYTATDGSEQFLISDTSDTALVKIVQEGTGAALQVHDAGSDTSILQVNQVGTVAIGHTAAGGGGYGKLQVNGINYSTAHGADSGSASSPSFQFVGDQNTGMFSGGTDIIGFSTGGTERLAIGAAGEVLIGGTAAGTSGQVLTSGGSGAAVSWTSAGGGAIASIQDLKPQIDSDRLESVSGAGNYQKTLGGAPFFLNLASWSTIGFTSTDFRDGSNNTFVVMWPYMGSGETMVKSRAYRVSVGNQDNDTELNFVWYASDAKGFPTGAPVNSGICTLTNSHSAGAAVLEATWTNGPTLTAGELYWFGVFVDTTSSDATHTTDMGNIRATPSFEQEALGFSSTSLLLNAGNFGRVTGLKCSTSCGTTNGSRTAPTIGADTISLATGAGFNIPRVSFEVTYS